MNPVYLRASNITKSAYVESAVSLTFGHYPNYFYRLSYLTPRLRTRISNLRGLLTHLTTLEMFPTNITTSHDQELQDHPDRIEQHFEILEVADRQGQQEEAQDDMDNMVQGAPRTHRVGGRPFGCWGQTDRRRENGYCCCY